MRIALFVLLFFISFESRAVTERTSDLRTPVPEFLVGDQEWGIQFEAGAKSQSGNFEFLSFNSGLSIFRNWGDFIGYIDGNYHFYADNEPFERQQNLGNITLRLDHVIDENWRLFVFNTHGYNEFQKILYRGSLGAGPWYQVETESLLYAISLAGVFEFENRIGPEIERIVRLSVRSVLSVDLSKTSTFSFDFFYMPAFEDFSDFRIILIPALNVSIIPNHLVLKTYALFERDLRPAPGVKRNDLELGTQFILSFGE